jgi:SAM-dependent MidA family methyltransferase
VVVWPCKILRLLRSFTMYTPIELPEPGADERAHSEKLSALVRRRLAAAGGWVDFSEYMNLALYAPGLGYYSAGATKFGAAGDFVTAPEVSELFARCVARAIAPILARNGTQSVLEVGAGTGVLAAGVLNTLARDGALPDRYRILEVSADLRERQRQMLAERAPDFASHVEWLDELPPQFDGVILANEVLDALPVSRFRIAAESDVVRAMGVGIDSDEFCWVDQPASVALRERVAAIEASIGAQLPAQFESEVNMNLAPFVASLADVIGDGACLLIDYGLPRRELYSPQRADGTLICHYRHRAHADPFYLPGLQDITAWVDFTATAEAAAAAGLRVDAFMTQAQFLIASGIEAEFELAGETHADAKAQLALSREMQTLLLPGEMGERFKLMWLGRGVAVPPTSFDQYDQRHRL